MEAAMEVSVGQGDCLHKYTKVPVSENNWFPCSYILGNQKVQSVQVLGAVLVLVTSRQ